MNWSDHRDSWPNAQFSRFVESSNCRFHVQEAGEGPVIVLLHGTGATTHSFAEVLPILAENHKVVAIDLPGHGFSSGLKGQRTSLPNVAIAIAGLMQQMDVHPAAIVGHSAGAAIAVEMVAGGLCDAGSIVSINGAFYPFPGFSGEIFPAMARLLFLNPFVPKFFAYSAGSTERVARLIESTGSRLSASQLELYQCAFRDTDHVEGTLSLMANWDLSGMAARLEALEVPVLQIIGKRDGTIDPGLAHETAARLRDGRLEILPHAGHLAHEEYPKRVAELVMELAARVGNEGRRKLA